MAQCGILLHCANGQRTCRRCSRPSYVRGTVNTDFDDGPGRRTAEAVAAFGLVASILGCLRWRPEAVPYAVGLFITAGYWFTSSTSFANPAETFARSFTDTFSGIMPAAVPGFIAAQVIGAIAATIFLGWLFNDR